VVSIEIVATCKYMNRSHVAMNFFMLLLSKTILTVWNQANADLARGLPKTVYVD